MEKRKFNIKKEFSELNDMENKVFPMMDEIMDQNKRDIMKNYISRLFNYKLKKKKMGIIKRRYEFKEKKQVE